jgi:lysozyme
MNDDLHLSPAGQNLIKSFEGCLTKVKGGFMPYVCPAGVLTVGWGTTGENGNKIIPGKIWTKEQVDSAFVNDMKVFENAVKRAVKVPLKQYQFDALVSFTYNCGAGNFGKSTLLKLVNRQDFAGAAGEFKKWNKGGGKVLAGLTRRRASEALLFQNIPDADYDGRPDAKPSPSKGLMPQGVDSPEGEV